MRSRRHLWWCAAVCAATVGLVGPAGVPSANAQYCLHWTVDDGNWGVPGNWELGTSLGKPGADDDGCFHHSLWVVQS